MTKREAEQTEAIAELRKILKPGSDVYTNVEHVSSSGMTRHISLHVPYRDKGSAGRTKLRIRNITWLAARAMGERVNRDNGGIVVGGCGMDMCFGTVYNLGRVLFPKGYKLPKGAYGRNGDASGFDPDGGYALNKVNL